MVITELINMANYQVDKFGHYRVNKYGQYLNPK